MAEAGMPDFDTGIWFGVMAPAGTPQAIVGKLAKATAQAMRLDETRAALRGQGVEPLDGGPERFASFIVSEMAKWSEAAKAAGLKK
jgi:tripartite-type tricarboxylate transporter receptor subunit TctC